MTTREYITHSAEETIALGRELAPTLKNARMVILRGDLGAGKTTLVKGIAEGLQAASARRHHQPHIHADPRIPRAGRHAVPRRSLSHRNRARACRLSDLDELFAEPGNLVLLEWGEKFPRFQRERDVEIAIERRGSRSEGFGLMVPTLPIVESVAQISFQFLPIKGPGVKFTSTFSDASCGGLGLLPTDVFNGNEPRYNFAIAGNENLLALLDAVQQRSQPIFRLKRTNFRHDWKTITKTEGAGHVDEEPALPRRF